MERSKTARAYVIGIFFWVLSFVLALKYGAIPDADPEIIAQLRLPRVLLASAVGIGLSVAGAALQALFSNPLSEPYTLGISSGSALGAVLGSALGLQWMVSGIAGTSFAGALLFTAILYLIAHRPGTNSVMFLLAGVMLGFLGSSLVALWMAFADANGIQGALMWLLGDLSRARLQGAAFSMAGVLFLTLVVWRKWRELDALLMGEEGAASLGVPVAAVRRRLVITTSLLVALCVSAAGMIGFVGLVVPHFARKFVGSLHLRLIPLCAIWGAVVVTLADFIGRSLLRPYEVPVGVITALVGAPVFLWVILGRRETA